MFDSRLKRVLLGVFPALLLPLQVLLFGAHTIYSSNLQEFSAPFWSLAVQVLPLILAIAAGLTLVGVVIPARFFLSIVGLVSFDRPLIQGNLIVGDYGVLNGQDIDWSGRHGAVA
jgi:hypothetical protein